MSSLKLDFEQETRKIIKGIESIRCWRPRTKLGWFARLRRAIAIMLTWLSGLFQALSWRVDSWNTTPENDLEHSFKQDLLAIRMLVIEESNGNPYNLCYFRVLSWALMHDLSEGDPQSEGDVNYWKKREDPQTELASRRLEAEISRKIMNRLFSSEYQYWHPKNLDMDVSVSENEKTIWTAMGEINHCLFMLEEINIGRISRARRMRFYNNILNVHVEYMKKNAWHFTSVREIVEKEILPKWEAVRDKVL